MLDLARESSLFTTVERRETYLGHPSTVLFRDGRTLLVAYPDGHGRGNLILRRSRDAGNTWQPVALANQRVEETPVLYRLDMPGGAERVLLVTCRPREGVLEWMWSDDRGDTWSARQSWKLEGTQGIIVALASLWPIPGDTPAWRGVFHDFRFDNYTVDLRLETDAQGATVCRFDNLRRIEYATAEGLAAARRAGLCEAGLAVRPDGRRIALLFRPEKRVTNSMVSFSDDAGLTWTDPREMPGALTGHRHESVNLADGRMMVFMRDYSPLNPGNPSHGDWVAWVGTFEDIERGREGQYRIRLRRNYGNSTNNSIGDCGYSGVEMLPDGTVLAITYGHWEVVPGSTHPNHPDGRGKPSYILQIKIDPRKADAWVKDPARLIPTKSSTP
ncbi:MAG: exo-alpha-sialidase [Kiritimatiellae bacterium]|nr:exo-alpha-sialidase [Kiritimatiellia bacterium]